MGPLKGDTRPPFVMNTVVDEEELGWDDEEEEDVDDVCEEDEDWQAKLGQVEEEKDVLHQTIELQRKELEGLNVEKVKLMTSVEDKSKELDSIKTSLGGDQKDFIEKIAEQEVSIKGLERESMKKDEEIKLLKEQNQDYEGLLKKMNEEITGMKKDLNEKDKKIEEANNQMQLMVEE